MPGPVGLLSSGQFLRKIFDSERHKSYVGTGNALILDNLKKLFQSNAKIRIPIVPNVNDSKEEMNQIKDFLCAYGNPEKVELLPYHAMGENKYRAIGKEPRKFKVPDQQTVYRLENSF